MTPPGDDVPGIVTVARKTIDAQAATLLDAALESVKDAKGRKLSLATAMAEWQEIAKAAQAAAPTKGGAGQRERGGTRRRHLIAMDSGHVA